MSSYQNQWIIVDESLSSSSEQNDRPRHVLPDIRIPFPPNVNPADLISKRSRRNSKLPTKPPNAFMIYRSQYVKELHARSCRLPMRIVSALVASVWREEPDNVIEYYEKIAREVSVLYHEKYPRPPQQRKQAQKKKCGSAKSTFTPLVEHLNGQVLNYVDDVRRHYNPVHYYSDHNQTLSTEAANHSPAHGGHHYHSHNMYSPPSSYAFEQHYGNSGMHSPSSFSAPYPPVSPNLHMQLPHLNSLIGSPYGGMYNFS